MGEPLDERRCVSHGCAAAEPPCDVSVDADHSFASIVLRVKRPRAIVCLDA